MIGPDEIEPYTARLRLEGTIVHAESAVAALLEDIARGCELAGASVIGHIKCHVRLEGGGSFHCNLTSTRSGATCVWASGSQRAGVLGALELDLAVLVYGVEAAAIARLVEEAVGGFEPRVDEV